MKIGGVWCRGGKPYEKAKAFLWKAGCDPKEDWIIYLNSYEAVFGRIILSIA